MSNVLEFNEKPGLVKAYVNVFSPGRQKYAGLDRLPKLEARWMGATETPEKVQQYREACGFSNDGMFPVLYPHILTSAMHIHLLADKRFPASALGAVHARSHILQCRPIPEKEPLNLRCFFSDARVLKAGLEVDVTTTVNAGEERVWESVNAYLFRGKKFGAPGEAHPWTTLSELGEPTITGKWHVPADMGRRYAKITGDYNPIHISKILAKAFGFPRDIIHGMWSEAKCLNHLTELSAINPLRLDIVFKGPVFMDSDCTMKGQEIEGGYRFDLFCGKNPRPSIVSKVGTAKPGDTLVES